MPLEMTPIDPGQLSTEVARVVGAAGPAKMMAARGMVPMGPASLVTVLYQLSRDPDAGIRATAEATAGGLPDGILNAALGESLDPRVLQFFAQKVLKNREPLEKLLLNKAVHEETLAYLGGKLAEREVEILAGNTERLLRFPAIIEAIYFNKQARMSTVNRLLELAVRNGLTLNNLPAFKEIAESILGRAPSPAPTPAAAPTAAVPATDVSAVPAAPAVGGMGEQEALMDEAFSTAFAEGEDWEEGAIGEMEFEEVAEEQEEQKITRISDLPMVAKIRLASIGTTAHRSVLIKDSNKLVSMAVIKSPAVSDQEAMRYAADRTLHQEIIRYISNKKEWLKSYKIKLHLVNNPKCPPATAMKYISHLRVNDLRMLSRSKNVPAAIAKAAKQQMRKRK